MALDSMWVVRIRIVIDHGTSLQALLALPPIQLSIQAGCTARQNLEDLISKERQHLPAFTSAIVASDCSIETKTKGKLCRANTRRKQ